MTSKREVKTMATQSPLQQLPVELKQMILFAFSDVVTLKSIALSCSSFYCAFILDEVSITTHVFANQIGIDILPEVIATLESQTTPKTRRGVCDFFEKHLRARSPPPQQQSWTLSQALPIGTLHQSVQAFALLFASHALSQPSVPLELGQLPPHPPSPSEINRTEHAFYRFQMFTNLFRAADDNQFYCYGERGLFLSHFSPWENEQLACVRDFLMGLINPGRQVAANSLVKVLNAISL
jgi:hypothetical protein